MKPLYIFILLACLGCKKMLTKNPSSDFDAPDNLEKLSGLLKDWNLLGQTPVLGELSADDYYLDMDSAGFQNLRVYEKNAYLWKTDIFEGTSGIKDWNLLYQQISTANTVLDNLPKIAVDDGNRRLWNITKGQALFSRSFSLFNIAQLFADVYHENKANAPGIVIPLSANINTVPPRSSLKQSYDQITTDLKLAASLLEAQVPDDSRTLPNKPAAFALLARVYLSQSNYSQALVYADSTLAGYKKLIDYNNLNLSKSYPLTATNEETLYQSCMIGNNQIIRGKATDGNTIIDSTLYNSYDKNDLRRQLFFKLNDKKQPVFNVNYSGIATLFSGLATDETLLIRAECSARTGLLSQAVDDMNELLRNRYKSGIFTHYTTSTPALLDSILKERRKELPFRGLRWLDLRRLKEEENITLTRIRAGKVYSLPPNSTRYTLPIPPDALSPSIEQNIRD